VTGLSAGCALGRTPGFLDRGWWSIIPFDFKDSLLLHLLRSALQLGAGDLKVGWQSAGWDFAEHAEAGRGFLALANQDLGQLEADLAGAVEPPPAK
jgi:hypothetical protein